jgi:hydroxymethylpyrimidine pyrophosphatase-like HAD family hydrolase
MRRYYPRLETVDRIQDVSGQVFKFALSLPPKETRSFERALHRRVGDAVVPVTSGHGELDLGCPGVTKASGLDAVLRRWGVGWAEVAAFGDSANDLPMLSSAGFPVAMAGATEAVKAACPFTTEANDDDGVLNQLERWFEET